MEMGHFGFSWVGFIFLVMLMVPNLFWAKKSPPDTLRRTKTGS